MSSVVWEYDLVCEEQGGQGAALGVHVLLPHGDLVEGAGPGEVRHHHAALQHRVTSAVTTRDLVTWQPLR